VPTSGASKALSWRGSSCSGAASSNSGGRANSSARREMKREADLRAHIEFKIQFKSKTAPNLIRSKHNPPRIQKFKYNYRASGFEKMDNLCY
jgi:hypothetical protein